MKLVDEQKAERRARILARVRDLVADRGYDAVTMKDLAEACRVSVPTLYNLFGGKDELLYAAIEDQFERLMANLPPVGAGQGIDGIFQLVDACNALLLGAPRYTRSLVMMFSSSMGAQASSNALMGGLARQLELALTSLQQGGDVADWVDCRQLAEALRDQYIMRVFTWGVGNADDDELRRGTRYILSMGLLGATESDTARAVLKKRAREMQAGLRSGSGSRVAG